MSLSPRNIVVNNPKVVSEIILRTPLLFSSGFEASPIYQDISGTLTIDGSYSDGDFNFIYDNAVITIDPLERIAKRDCLPATPVIIERSISDERVDETVSIIIPSGKFTATSGFRIARNLQNRATPLDPPILQGDFTKTNPTSGILRDNSVSPPVDTDISADLSFSIGPLSGSISAGNAVFFVRAVISTSTGDGGSFDKEIDASAFTTPDWRDIRGTYSQTDTDVNGITYTWSFTIA